MTTQSAVCLDAPRPAGRRLLAAILARVRRRHTLDPSTLSHHLRRDLGLTTY